MRLTLLLAFGLFAAFALADAPFPNNARNRWVYDSMAAIKKDRLWYRFFDQVPKRTPSTRADMAKRTLCLAIDSKTLIDAFRTSVKMSAQPASDEATKKWSQDFTKTFPSKKVKYQTHLRRVARLWKYFQPEIKALGKELKVDVSAIGKGLARERSELDSIHLAA